MASKDTQGKQEFDLIVVGGGPGGYVAAIRAAQLGLKTAVVERDRLGGICLNWGCIPTKALLRSAEVLHLMRHAEEFGLSAKEISFDLNRVIERSRQVAGRLSKGVAYLLKKNKVTVIEGEASLTGPHTLSVTGTGGAGEEKGKSKSPARSFKAPHIILATGARARALPGIEPDGKIIWTYKHALLPDSLPKSLLVIGAGAIGMEFASFYNDLGVTVTVVELAERILPAEDAEIAGLAHKAFEKQGITLHTGAVVTDLKTTAKGATGRIVPAGQVGQKNRTADAASSKAGKETGFSVDRVILAAGITGNVEGLGLEKTKVKVEKGHVVVDRWLATGEPGLYAIGDLAGPPWLAHKASHEGIICVEKIAGKAGVHPLAVDNIPGCTYCRPQIASVGLTEARAKESGRKIRVGRFPYQGNGKAIALGDDEGLIKTIFDEKTGELLGAHLIGAEVTELIQGFAIARTLETTEAELMETIFPHPTLSEMMHESVLDAYGRVIHF